MLSFAVENLVVVFLGLDVGVLSMGLDVLERGCIGGNVRWGCFGDCDWWMLMEMRWEDDRLVPAC